MSLPIVMISPGLFLIHHFFIALFASHFIVMNLFDCFFPLFTISIAFIINDRCAVLGEDILEGLDVLVMVLVGHID